MNKTDEVTAGADWPSGRSGEVHMTAVGLAGSSSRKSVRLSDVDGRQKGVLMQSIFAYKKPKRTRSGLVMASKKREDKGGWKKLKGRKKKQTVRLPLPASLTIEHVAYEHYSKIPGHP